MRTESGHIAESGFPRVNLEALSLVKGVVEFHISTLVTIPMTNSGRISLPNILNKEVEHSRSFSAVSEK